MTTRIQVSIVLLLILLATTYVSASGVVGIYAIVSKVVLEPNDQTPERIQIWGAFTFVDRGTGIERTLRPRRGYLYFKLPSADESPTLRMAALTEWSDFKSIAGTGEAVAFGQFFFNGAFSEDLISQQAGTASSIVTRDMAYDRSHAENPVRAESTSPSSPSYYPMNMGLTKLSATGNLSAIVRELQGILAR